MESGKGTTRDVFDGMFSDIIWSEKSVVQVITDCPSCACTVM